MEPEPKPTWEEVDARIVEIMLEHGPDGHCDGHEVITDYVMTLLGHPPKDSST